MFIKLSHKFFIVFLLSTLASTTLIVGLSSYFIRNHFENYLYQQHLDEISRVIERLEAGYKEHQSWDFIINNHELWRELLKNIRRKKHNKPPHFRSHKPPFPLVLFDAQKQQIQGRSRFQAQEYHHHPISVGKQTVGWLGIPKHSPLSHPRTQAFLKQQISYLIGIGILGFLLSALIGVLFAKYLLRPIKKLTEGTQKIRHRHFTHHIPVLSNDELGYLAKDFNEMAKTLDHYEKTRKQWLTDISHELRTPISVLQGEIESLQDGVYSYTPELVDSLHQEVMILKQLVEHLHELSIADSGELELHLSPMTPLTPLQNSIKTFEHAFEKAGIAIELLLPEDLSQVFISADDLKLQQIFYNLFQNTLRYTDSPGKLIIGGSIHDGRLNLVFEDSTPGVPDESLSQLFERLYRVEESRNREKGGNGLGLSICKSYVEAMGGHIQASHSSLNGLKITLTFPIIEKGSDEVSPH